jgi:8-oxo-dGTP pyrophosphatase MutT (NUDIX family)
MPKRHTYGIFLEDCDGKILVCSPSNSDVKNLITIPKGGKDKGETDWQAAVREFKEEAGIDILPLVGAAKYVYVLPPVVYKSKAKTLYSFYIKLNTPIDVASCVCTTFTKFGKPEVMNHRLVKPEYAKLFMHESQTRALELLDNIKWFLSENDINTRHEH